MASDADRDITAEADRRPPDPTVDALPATHPMRDGRTVDARLIRAYRGNRDATRAVWFMRQAGRSLPEYRAARTGVTMLDSCFTPSLAAELTLQPVRRYGVDAAILFSDIMVPLRAAGVAVTIVPGRGPVIDTPIRTVSDIANLPGLDIEALTPVATAASLVCAELGRTPLVALAGGVFTVASYLVEGGPSKDQLTTRAMMHADPDAWHALARWVADTSIAFLRAQVLAGASAVQLFDSWAGRLPAADYAEFVLPHTREILAGIGALPVPRVHFAVYAGHLMRLVARSGAEVISVDHCTRLDYAAEVTGGAMPLQGNIDPALLFAGEPALHRHVDAVLEAGSPALAHVVGLGHGVPPTTDPGVLASLVDYVHAATDTAQRPGRPRGDPRGRPDESGSRPDRAEAHRA